MAERTPREEAERWLTEAHTNRRTVRALFEQGLYSQCAYHCQQTAEMALKAILYNAGMRPFGHSLTDLLDTIEELGVAHPDADVQEAAAKLNRHYIDSRYPDAMKDIAPTGYYTQNMAEQTIEWADLILRFALNILT